MQALVVSDWGIGRAKMKYIIAAIMLLATSEVAMAEDCDAPQSSFATFKDWSEYKEACEKTCEKCRPSFASGIAMATTSIRRTF